MYHHMETTKKQFVGKTLQGITRVDESTVRIHFGDGTSCKLNVEGDCCSYSIFYEIEMPEELKGAVLEDMVEGGCNSYGEKNISTDTADSDEVAMAKVKAQGFDFQGCLSVWNVVLKTNRGNALIRHINTSNGYYNGMTSYELEGAP